MKPGREPARNNGQTYFATSQTWQRRPLFLNPRWAELFLRVLDSYRGKGYLLHEYVLMPEHFHMLITPRASLEKAVQLVKGGFSFFAKKEIGSSLEIWQTGFSDHRIRDAEDYSRHVEYIRRNPVGRRLVEFAEEYAYCSSFPGSGKDEIPQWLKPLATNNNGAAKAAPLQGTEGKYLQGTIAVPLQEAAGAFFQATTASVQDVNAIPVRNAQIAVNQRNQYLGDHSRAENQQLETLGSKS